MASLLADPLELRLQKGGDRGSVIKAYISIEQILLELAQEVAFTRGLPLPLPRTTYASDAKDARTWRPSVILGRSAEGWVVLPMATFGGNAPETWDLLLRELVVPVGIASDHHPTFHETFFAQTNPPWRHGDGRPTYLVLRHITIPFTAETKWVRSKTVAKCITHLELMARDRATSLLRSYSIPEVENRLRSYIARIEKLFPSITTSQTAAQDSATIGSDEIENGGLSAAAPEFVPRWLHTDDEIGSFLYLVSDDGNGTSLLSLSAVITSSRLQALRPLAANDTDGQIAQRSTASSAPKLQAGHRAAEEADKENVAPLSRQYAA